MKRCLTLLLTVPLLILQNPTSAVAESVMPALAEQRGVAIVDGSKTSAVLPVADLDGDGRPDLVTAIAKPVAPGLYQFELRVVGNPRFLYTGRGRAIQMRSVATGSQAGTTSFGRVLLEVWTQAESPLGATGNLHLTMLDGNGGSLWDRPIPGNVVGTSVTPSSRWMVAGVVGLVQGPDGAQHPLVQTKSSTLTVRGNLTVGEARVYNASDGTPLGWSATSAENQDVSIVPTGDLDGDGMSDYVAVTAGGGMRSVIASHSSRDLGNNTNWIFEGGGVLRATNDLVVTTPGAKGAHVDLDGDLIPDVFVTEPAVPSADGTGVDGPRTHLLSGATGRFLWDAAVDMPGVVADLDGDGRPDLAAQTVRPDRIDYDGLSGATGATKWHVYSPLPSSFGFVRIRDTDSLPDDGVFAMGHVIEGAGFVDKGLVDGRNGNRLWSADVGIPLAASLDGKGDDLLRLTWESPEVLAMGGQDGATGRGLWRYDGACDARHPVHIGGAADLDGDGRAEVIVGCTPHDRTGIRWTKVNTDDAFVVLDASS